MPGPWRLLAERWPGFSGFALGAAAALALPPLHLLPALLAFAGLLHLLRRGEGGWRAFRIGWAFGLGWFLAGLYWIAIAFFTDAERFGALAFPAVVGLSAYLALLPGLACWLVGRRRWHSPAAMALALALLWVLAEKLRGDWGLAFPWNPVALTWAVSDSMLQSLAWIGTDGLGVLTVALAAWPAVLLAPETTRAERWGGGFAALLVLLAAWSLGSWRLQQPIAGSAGPEIRIVQGNVPQTLKWDPEQRAGWFRRYLDLSLAKGAGPEPRILVWPETAVPFQIATEPVVRDAIAAVVPAGGYVLTGGNHYQLDQDPPVAHNSLFALGPDGTIAARYDKVDLVPFGEYLPFRDWLALIGLEKLTAGTIDFLPGPGRATLHLADLPAFSPLICYEAIFPGRAARADDRPDWLLNITNDAWFGTSSGPYQHLAMARMRAIETGLPLIRAANTGISAVIDAHGRILAKLALGVTGYLDAALPVKLATPPPISRWPLAIDAGIALLLALAALGLERRARR